MPLGVRLTELLSRIFPRSLNAAEFGCSLVIPQLPTFALPDPQRNAQCLVCCRSIGLPMQRTVRQKCAARRNFRNLEVIRFNLWLNFRSDRMIHDGSLDHRHGPNDPPRERKGAAVH